MNFGLTIAMSALLLSSCFQTAVQKPESVSKRSRTAGSPSPVISAKTLTENKAVFAIDPNAQGATILSAPTGGLAGASVAIPPNTLSISADFIFEEAVPFQDTSLASNLSIDSATTMTELGKGMVIRPSVDLELQNPLQISLPLKTSLRLVRNISVFYKQFREGVLRDGVVANKSLTFTEDNKVSFEGYFGSYWVVEASAPIEDRAPVETTEPVVNFQKVAVIESTGINAESTVTTKAELPLLVWKTPTISFAEDSRTLTMDAEVEGNAPVNGCLADIYASVDAKTGTTVQTGAILRTSLAITKKEAHVLFGRFRCFDENGRLTTSAWTSALSVPVFVEAPAAPVYVAADFVVQKPLLQSREMLRLALSAELAKVDFTIFNVSSNATIFDTQILNDGRETIALRLSPLGTLDKFAYAANQLSLRGRDGKEWLTAAFSIRDFTIFEGQVNAAFANNKQMNADGFQAWTNVLLNPVVNDKAGDNTKLTTGMLNIINP